MPEHNAASSHPKLTILVPTFNRALFLPSLLEGLCAQAAALPRGGIEIVVANNQSTDETAEIVENLAQTYSFLKLFTQPVHLYSAEENILEALSSCSAEFVWTVSDDDRISERALAEILVYLRDEETAFLLMNVSLLTTSGKLRRLLYIGPEVSDRLSGYQTLDDIVTATGFMGLLTSISSVVFRRADVLDIDWRSLVKISKIYSHAAIFYKAFADKKSQFVPTPLVWVYDDEGVALEKIAFVSSTAGTQRFFTWTVGLSRLIAALKLDIGKIVEVTPNGSYRLGDLMLSITCDQIGLWFTTGSASEALTHVELREIARNISHTSDVRYHHLWGKLVQAGHLMHILARPSDPAIATTLAPLRALPASAVTDLQAVIRARVTTLVSEVRAGLSVFPEIGVSYRFGEYNVREAKGRWIATHMSITELDYGVEEPVEALPHVLVEGDRGSIEQRLRSLRFAQHRTAS